MCPVGYSGARCEIRDCCLVGNVQFAINCFQFRYIFFTFSAKPVSKLGHMLQLERNLQLPVRHRLLGPVLSELGYLRRQNALSLRQVFKRRVESFRLQMCLSGRILRTALWKTYINYELINIFIKFIIQALFFKEYNCLDPGYACTNGGTCGLRPLGDYICYCNPPYCGVTCSNVAPNCELKNN